MYDIRSSNSNGGGHVQTANKGGTGQTAFTKGDLLVATSASVLSKLGVGSDGAALVVDSAQAAGIKWGTAGNAWSLKSYSTGSVISSIVVSSLSMSTDTTYHIIAQATSSVAGAGLSLRFNGSAAANYNESGHRAYVVNGASSTGENRTNTGQNELRLESGISTTYTSTAEIDLVKGAVDGTTQRYLSRHLYWGHGDTAGVQSYVKMVGVGLNTSIDAGSTDLTSLTVLTTSGDNATIRVWVFKPSTS